MVPLLLSLPDTRADFFCRQLLWELSQCPAGKPHEIVGLPAAGYFSAWSISISGVSALPFQGLVEVFLALLVLPVASQYKGSACTCLLSHFSHIQLFTTAWTIARQAPLSMGFSRQEYGSGLPRPPPGDPPDPGMEPASLMSPASAGRFFTIRTAWEALEGNQMERNLPGYFGMGQLFQRHVGQ